MDFHWIRKLHGLEIGKTSKSGALGPRGGWGDVVKSTWYDSTDLKL